MLVFSARGYVLVKRGFQFYKADYWVVDSTNPCLNMIYRMEILSFCLQKNISNPVFFIWQINLCTSGLFLPAVVRPILDSFETSKQVPQPPISDVSNIYASLSDHPLAIWVDVVLILLYSICRVLVHKFL